MTFTITISETNPKAKSIIDMFRMLSKDYDFMHIEEVDENLDFMSSSQKIEFEKRYDYTINNLTDGKTLEEIEAKYFINE